MLRERPFGYAQYLEGVAHYAGPWCPKAGKVSDRRRFIGTPDRYGGGRCQGRRNDSAAKGFARTLVIHPQGMFLIDGAHRIAARVRAGLDWVHGYALSSHSMATIQVRLFRLENGGSRTEVDTTKGWASIAGGSS
jgi:hypothetical protein